MILREGCNKGLLAGRNEGLTLGRDEGLTLGRDEGLTLGRDEGLVIGRLQEARDTLYLLRTRRFGEPTAEHQAKIEATASREQLEKWLLAVLEAKNWGDLFQ